MPETQFLAHLGELLNELLSFGSMGLLSALRADVEGVAVMVSPLNAKLLSRKNPEPALHSKRNPHKSLHVTMRKIVSLQGASLLSAIDSSARLASAWIP